VSAPSSPEPRGRPSVALTTPGVRVASYDTMWQKSRPVEDPASERRPGPALSFWVVRSRTGSKRLLTAGAAVGLLVAVAFAVFGLPPVDVHPPFHYVGVMDPLCGMTRGSVATVRGDLARAWWYNPGSPFVILGGLALVGRWVGGRAAGVWVEARLRRTPWTVAVVGLLTLALEVNQQMHATRLR
jgi:hypothetical protein